MEKLSYAQILHRLSVSYYDRNISVEEYRIRRKNILNDLDYEHNGTECFDTIRSHKVDDCTPITDISIDSLLDADITVKKSSYK